MKYATRVEVDLVIGNEVDRRDVVVYSPQDILGAMQYAKREVPGYPSVAARVTTCFSGTAAGAGVLPGRAVVDECEQVV